MMEMIGQILVAKNIITAFDLSMAMERKKWEPAKYLGLILGEMGFCQSKIIRELYYGQKRKQLGEILVDLKMITTEQLQDALRQQKDLKSKGAHTLLGNLLARNGAITEKNYIEALSAHFSMPVVSLKAYKVSPNLQKAIGEQFTLNNRIVVLKNNPQKVVEAIAEPHLLVYENLERALPKGKSMVFCLARASEIENCQDKTYDPF